MTGSQNINYKEKIKVHCDNCGKEIEKIPSLTHNINKQGKNHNFCSYECYWEFRKKYYVGDKLYNTGKKMDENFCNKVREATLKQYQDGILDRQTIPQKIVNSILEKNDINYINEKIFKYYSVDNYLIEHNLIIEVMGDYFHVNHLIYTDSNEINQMQKKDIDRDKSKHTYIKKYQGVEILYLWESDIKNNPLLCEELIKKYIELNGKLKEYNSFNFSFCDNNLKLNNNIIKPYFI